MKVSLLEHQVIPNIGTLSDAVSIDSDVYFIGDDVRYLFKANKENNLTHPEEFEKIPLFENFIHVPLVSQKEFGKSSFDILTSLELDGQKQLLMMGSGSAANRKQALLYDPRNHQIKTLLTPNDYDFLAKNKDFTGGADLDIEAVCATKNKLYIFQYGIQNLHHGVLIFNLKKLKQKKSLKQSLINSFTLHLPELSKSRFGIAKASFVPNQSLIAAIASASQTTDTSQVLENFVVLMTLNGEVFESQAIYDEQHHPLPIKIKGMTWLKSTESGEVFLLIADNHDGDAEILKVEVSSKPPRSLTNGQLKE